MKEFQVFYVPLGCACDSEWVYLGTVSEEKIEEVLVTLLQNYSCKREELVCVACCITPDLRRCGGEQQKGSGAK